MKHILEECKLPDKFTSSHSNFGIKIGQKQTFGPFIFPALFLDVDDGMLLSFNCQQHPSREQTS